MEPRVRVAWKSLGTYCLQKIIWSTDSWRINSIFKAKEFLERNSTDLGYESSDQGSEEEEKEEKVLIIEEQETCEEYTENQKTKKKL